MANLQVRLDDTLNPVQRRCMAIFTMIGQILKKYYSILPGYPWTTY